MSYYTSFDTMSGDGTFIYPNPFTELHISNA